VKDLEHRNQNKSNLYIQKIVEWKTIKCKYPREKAGKTQRLQEIYVIGILNCSKKLEPVAIHMLGYKFSFH